ncbi:putative quinol monooxygenase [Paraconexibacter algicola]|nr:antibiotic biosynthesis monooxygenase family protein [Paraconexibacter algicola]
MARPGLVIQFKTKPDTAEQFSDILVAALEHVEAEAGTRPWLTLRAEQDPTVFYLVDLFDDEDARNIHLNGAAAELILGTGGALLAEQPSPVPVTLVIGKAV